MEGEYKVSNYYSEERVEKYRVKVIENPRISEENKSMILEFHEICRAQGLTRGRLAKTLWIMRTIGELMDQQSFRTATRSDLESIPFLVETLYGSRLIRPPSSSISSTSSPQSSTRA